MDFSQLDEYIRGSRLLGQQGFTNQQTHISSVYIGQNRVIKIKKPVNLGFVDYSTLQRRKHFCEQEVLLNRRMSHGIYMGVSSLHQVGDAVFLDHQSSEACEYAVIMNRIPEDLLLDKLIFMSVSPGHLLDGIIEKLTTFYLEAENGPNIAYHGNFSGIRKKTDDNFCIISHHVGLTLSQEEYDTLVIVTDALYKKLGSAFDQRADGGRVRDCHGDLRLEHLCYMDGAIHAIDCIEFSESLRCCDILNDLAFLLMDMDYLGFTEFSAYLERRMLEALGEEGGSQLVAFYKLYRAMVRAKVEGLTIQDEYIPQEEKDKGLRRARRYIELALHYGDEMARL
ncbi:hypothetical protein [Desulfurispira natronophila]|uniref:Aminoglycoside phosphotransferase domain-containing protein n=1 Tax=Desulfurispira natronophila TaxID=682562 RepID=A0A7W7Y3Z9_9BACT|nr:hypothetical protein [Desulfurispira natronophila]MBB5021619.1 hypothetical protein [Desulfurispira natronophila]